VRRAIPSTPLVANGDIRTARDACACLAASGADAVMIGRAALGRPWLAGMIAQELATGQSAPEPSLAVKLAATLEHHESLVATMGEPAGVRHARKHLAAALDDAAAHGAGAAAMLKPSILQAESASSVHSLMKNAFAPVVAHRAEAA
jgi:tRNA-dihydrouridine synthase